MRTIFLVPSENGDMEICSQDLMREDEKQPRHSGIWLRMREDGKIIPVTTIYHGLHGLSWGSYQEAVEDLEGKLSPAPF
jgi:hypothetical protein